MVEEKIKEGYKKTEVGILPIEWEIKQLKDILSKPRLGGNYSNSERETRYPLIKMGNLSRGSINIDKVEYIIDRIIPSQKDRLKYGDVLFNTRNTLDLVGKVAIWRDELPEAYYNSNIMLLDFIKTEIESPFYLNFILNTKYSLSQLRNIATGTTSVAAIYTRDLIKLSIPVPPVHEQNAIVTALNEVENLIKTHEKLIDKKKKIKQGTMQQLLTGKIRLSGFSDEWVKCNISQLLSLKKGSQLNRDTLSLNDKYPVINGGVDPSGYTSIWNTSEGTITISEGGNSCGYVNLIKSKFWAGGHAYTIKLIQKDLDNLFIYYLLKNNEPKIMSLRVGSGLPNIQKKSIENFELSLPINSQEQIAISNVLSDMDLEIEELV